MEIVNLAVFLEDEKVLDVIEQRSGKVNLVPGSDSGLTAGNGRITDLDPSKYYIIEEWDENLDPVDVRFVQGNGTRSTELTDIGIVRGRTITGLDNDNFYKVKSAMPLTGTVTYYDTPTVPPPPPTGTPQIITGGAITLPAPTSKYYLNLSSIFYSPDGYDVVKVLSSSGSTSNVTVVSGNIIALEGQDTVTDYVFVERDNAGDIIPEKFYVLSSTILKAVVVPGPANITVTVTFSLTDQAASFTVSGNSISQDDFIASGLTLTLNGTLPTGATVSWKYDNAAVGDNSSSASNKISYNANDSTTYKYIIPGVHTISVEITVGGITYSKEFQYTVTIP